MASVLRACGFAAGLACAAVSRADEHSWEISGGVAEHELDVLLDSERSSISATRYFAPVDDSGGPFALAAFLDPASRVAVTASREESTSHVIGPGSANVPDLVSEQDNYSISGRYVLPRSKWYVGGAYTAQDPETPPELEQVVTDADIYGVLVGKYLGAATTLELRLDRAEHVIEAPAFYCVVGQFCARGGQTTSERETDDVRLDALHVRRFRGLTYALSGSVAQASGEIVLSRSEFVIPPLTFPLVPGLAIAPSITVPASTTEVSVPRTRSYSAGAELFPTDRVGVRVGYTRFDDDTAADDAYDVGASWFFRRNIAVEFVYSRQSADPEADFRRQETGSVRVLGRF